VVRHLRRWRVARLALVATPVIAMTHTTTTHMSLQLRRVSWAAAAITLLASAPRHLDAQWSTTYEQFYLQAPHNWVFRDRYVGADRLFNGFDYGHAILYETLWTKPSAPTSLLEHKEYDHLTKGVLVSPPRLPLEEAAVEIEYAKLAPEAKVMFDWAHILHRQIYDVLADERLSDAQKDADITRLLAYYRTRPDIAFSAKPKSMKLMQEQPYSLAFRQRYPKFNGLIWAYHWMQVGLYEPLIVNTTTEGRQLGVRATVARFWQMLQDPPHTFPYQMPMTAAVAPRFAGRYPEAAIIFDNLHSMHDVVSDILANASVPRGRKRAEILRAALRFRDDTSYVMPVDAWRAMAQHMGVENMGGPAVGFLAALPVPTVTYGAVMTHDDRTGAMTGFKYGSATGGEHAAHAAAPTRVDSAGEAHRGHEPAKADSAHVTHDTMTMTDAMRDSAHARQMMELHERMMADPAIMRRVQADTAMRRLMNEVMQSMPEAHRKQMLESMSDTAKAAPRSHPSPKAAQRPTRKPQATSKPAPKPSDPHAGHGAPRPTAKP